MFSLGDMQPIAIRISSKKSVKFLEGLTPIQANPRRETFTQADRNSGATSVKIEEAKDQPTQTHGQLKEILKNVELKQGITLDGAIDSLVLIAKSPTFDIVSTLNALFHLKDQQTAGRVHRILSPDQGPLNLPPAASSTSRSAHAPLPTPAPSTILPTTNLDSAPLPTPMPSTTVPETTSVPFTGQYMHTPAGIFIPSSSAPQPVSTPGNMPSVSTSGHMPSGPISTPDPIPISTSSQMTSVLTKCVSKKVTFDRNNRATGCFTHYRQEGPFSLNGTPSIEQPKTGDIFTHRNTVAAPNQEYQAWYCRQAGAWTEITTQFNNSEKIQHPLKTDRVLVKRLDNDKEPLSWITVKWLQEHGWHGYQRPSWAAA